MLVLLCIPGRAEAACTTSSGTADLGTLGSFAAATSQTAEATTGFVCTGGLLSLVSTNTITATVTSATNSQGTQARLHNAVSGDYIPYSICQDAACNQTYGVGSQIVWSETTFLGILGLFNSSDGSLPIYLRTGSGNHVAAGTYTSTISIQWDWHLCAVGLFGLCIYDDGTDTSTINVTMVVTADCVLSAPPVNFGSAAFAGSFDPVTQTLTVRCTKGENYSVGIDNGLHYAANRRLSDGTNFISYEIYYPQGSNDRWGFSAGERRSSNEATTGGGIYTGTSDQTYTFRAEILAGQITPPAATYSDTLTVDIQF
ncbi:spore coat U domain-containing protein [Sphingopyxis granuli]|uniref:Csu type fimbrial protein n=1 Tax=Sphingopyxis granuli TaxID=267128 RepID=UPI001F53B49D|nr:spore coat U domain-containing protein [Sphingopyxis granuli]UNK79782.1 spore coat U domain-containing protein [Sphingopyxis granuli]